MAGVADDEGFASPFCHERRPRGLVGLSRRAEVGELADLVNIHLAGVPAHLAPPREESTDQLLAAGGRDGVGGR